MSVRDSWGMEPAWKKGPPDPQFETRCPSCGVDCNMDELCDIGLMNKVCSECARGRGLTYCLNCDEWHDTTTCPIYGETE